MSHIQIVEVHYQAEECTGICNFIASSRDTDEHLENVARTAVCKNYKDMGTGYVPYGFKLMRRERYVSAH